LSEVLPAGVVGHFVGGYYSLPEQMDLNKTNMLISLIFILVAQALPLFSKRHIPWRKDLQ
jgi:hypothetical protein